MANKNLEKYYNHYNLLEKQAKDHNNPISFYVFELRALESNLKQLPDSDLDKSDQLTKKMLLANIVSSLSKTDA